MPKGFMAYRLGHTLLVLWVISTLLFLIFRLMPGNPLVAYIDPTFTREQQEALMKAFGLDKPLWVQYLAYMKNLARGELGRSFTYKEPVADVVWAVLPNTVYLMVFSLLLAYLIGITGGIVLAWKRGTRIDVAGVLLTLVTRAAPEFWTGMMLLAIFSFSLGWLPASGASSPGAPVTGELAKLLSLDFWRHMILPSTTMAIYLLGLPLLLMRNSMLDVLEEDFVTMARMKGLSEWAVMSRHAARNALLPVVTAMALGVGYTVGGNVVVETVFGWPGIGRVLVHAVSAHDYPLAQGAFLMAATVMVLMNLGADLMYGVLDPRVRYQRK